MVQGGLSPFPLPSPPFKNRGTEPTHVIATCNIYIIIVLLYQHKSLTKSIIFRRALRESQIWMILGDCASKTPSWLRHITPIVTNIWAPHFYCPFSALVTGSNITLEKLLIQLKGMTQWFMLGIHLKVPSDRLKDIKEMHKGNTELCKCKMLIEWCEREYSPKWESLIEALVKVELHSIALKIAIKNCEWIIIRGPIMLNFYYVFWANYHT